MEYRKLGKIGFEIGEISLGAEHLEGQDPEIVTSVVNHALDRGINYIDLVPCTSPVDRDNMGMALRGRREETMISIHFGIVEKEGQFFKTRDTKRCEDSFWEFLSRLDTDHTDILMLSWIDQEDDFQAAFDENGYLGAALRIKGEGAARVICLSTHIVSVAERAIQSGVIDGLMFPVNAAHDMFPGDYGLNKMWDPDTQEELMGSTAEEVSARVTTRGGLYTVCEQAGIGLIAMKPYAGGLLLKEGPMTPFLEQKEGLRHPGGMVLNPMQCINYVLSRPGMSTALIGCRSTDQIDAALAYYDCTEAEKDFSSIDTHALWRLAGRCTYCNHCLPCPEDIEIGNLMRILDSEEHSPSPEIETQYALFRTHAEDCTHCRVCMDRCPFGVRVTERMQKAISIFGY